jgi:hypothetical protein
MMRTLCFRFRIALMGMFLLTTLEAKPLITTPEGIFALDQGTTQQGVFFARVLGSYEKQFLSVTEYPQEASPPVLILLHPDADALRDSPGLRVDSLEGGFPRIQVDVSLRELDGVRTRRLLAQAMLLRAYYGSVAPIPGSQIRRNPDWLLHALGMMCSPSRGTVVIPAQFLKGQNAPTIENFLLQPPPQDENRSLVDLYDAMCASLLQAALKSPNASVTLREWIGKYDPNSPQAKQPSWPDSWKMRSIEKRWLLLMAGSRGGDDQGAASLLSVRSTLSRYDELLNDLPTPGHSLAMLKNQKGGEFIARDLSFRLQALRLQANPLGAPLLDETVRFLADLKHLSLKRLQEQEKQLSSLRDEVLKKATSIGEYLDWYEAAKVPVRSGLYDRLLATPEAPLKKGPLGRYLDAIEERGW